MVVVVIDKQYPIDFVLGQRLLFRSLSFSTLEFDDEPGGWHGITSSSLWFQDFGRANKHNNNMVFVRKEVKFEFQFSRFSPGLKQQD